jgi:hypothetical protein
MSARFRRHLLIGFCALSAAAPIALGGLVTADAATGIVLNSATVPGGSGPAVVLDLTYSCDRGSGATEIHVHADDPATHAVGVAQAVPTCDGAAHTIDVAVHSLDAARYRRGRVVHCFAALTDANAGHVVARDQRDAVAR